MAVQLSGSRALVLAAVIASLPGCRLRPAEREDATGTSPPGAQSAGASAGTSLGASIGASPASPDRAGTTPASKDENGREPARAVEVGYPALPVEALASGARHGVVNIRTTARVKGGPGAIYPGPQAVGDGSLGSGVVIDREGRVLTNDHVIAQAREIFVRSVDGTERPARVLGRAPELDIALLDVDGDPLVPVPLGESSSLRVGEWVVALGNPFGNEVVASAGVVTSVDGTASTPPGADGSPYRTFVVTDAAIHAGNSGGPLLDMAGRVVGISVATAPAGGRLGFAVPIDHAAAALGMLERDGRIRHAWLGLYIQPVTPALAASRGLAGRGDGRGGALVTEVRPDTPAARAGILPDDVILRFDGQDVDHRDLPWLVATAGAGRPIAITLDRAGTERTLEVTSELRPE
jgi:serine protease Do